MLCCAPGIEVLRDGFGEAVPVVPLSPTRPISVEALRALAPAVSPDNAAILVRCPRADETAGPCEIAGVLHVGSNLARARTGRSFYYRPAPFALMIDVRDAGELHIYQGGIKLASLKAGRLHDQVAYSALEFLPITDLLARGEDALRPRIVAPDHEPARETSDFEWTALLNTILCIVNGVKAHGHGGTVLLVAPGSEATLPIRAKFSVDESRSVLSDRFVEFLNTRHVLTEARLHRKRTREGTVPDAALSHLQNAAFAAEESLAGAADVVAGLTRGRRRARPDVRPAGPGLWRRDRARRGRAGRGLSGGGALFPRRAGARGRQRELRHAAPVGPPLRGLRRGHRGVRRVAGRTGEFFLEAGRARHAQDQRKHRQSEYDLALPSFGGLSCRSAR